MRPIYLLLLLFVSCVSAFANSREKLPADSHGLPYPHGWQEWSSIAVSYRTDNKTVRAILGNDIAVKAARSGQTNPWPDGSILGKVVWKETPLEHWSPALGPKEFVHAEFMFKDAVKYAKTYGWGWARWVGEDQEPFTAGTQVCTSCHAPVKERDWVYTDPAPFPEIK